MLQDFQGTDICKEIFSTCSLNTHIVADIYFYLKPALEKELRINFNIPQPHLLAVICVLFMLRRLAPWIFIQNIHLTAAIRTEFNLFRTLFGAPRHARSYGVLWGPYFVFLEYFRVMDALRLRRLSPNYLFGSATVSWFLPREKMQTVASPTWSVGYVKSSRRVALPFHKLAPFVISC